MALVQYFPANSAGRDYVVGDIHGCFGLFQRALAAIGFERATDRMFCVGDLIDRGTESERVLALLDTGWFISVRGNHEQMALDALAGPNPCRARQLWRLNGGGWFDALGRADKLRAEERMAALPYLAEIETAGGRRLGLVHADVAGDDWIETRNRVLQAGASSHPSDGLAELVWSRDRVARLPLAGEDRVASGTIAVTGVDAVYFGHTPLDAPVACRNTRWLDTGAVFGNALSIAEARPDGNVWLVDTTTGTIEQGWRTID